MDETVQDLLVRLYTHHNLEKEQFVFILDHLDDESKKMLFELANKTRIEHYGRRVFMRGLIEFSNLCKQDCLYCGIRKSNKTVDRYRLSFADILACCEEGYNLGYRTFVLQSGEDFWFSTERMSELIRLIKKQYEDVAITLSVGERSYETYQAWYEAGASRYLLRHETASPALYAAMHPTMTFANRRACLANLKQIGYQIGAGFMVGLPEQTHEDLALDLLYIAQLQPHMIGIGPFIPHHATPLADSKGGTVDDTLVMVALARLIVPDGLLPATTAIGSLHPRGRELALQAGANVVMPNLSPIMVREKYELYENKICTGDESAACRACIEVRISAAGYTVDMQRGDSTRITPLRFF